MSDQKNPRIVLAARPKGAPAPEDFRLELAAAPVPGEGGVLLRTLYLSLDPYMRGMMNERAPAYTRSIAIGEVMPGGTVNRVVTSGNPRFKAGDLVLGNAGWQELSVSDGKDLVPLGALEQPSRALYLGRRQDDQPLAVPGPGPHPFDPC